MQIALILFINFIACGGKIKELYESEKASVFAPAGKLNEDWQPDARLRITYDSIQKLGKQNLQSTIGTGKFEKSALGVTLSIESRNTVDTFEISNARGAEHFKFKSEAIDSSE